MDISPDNHETWARGGRAYWHVWSIALAALALCFVGLLAFGVGFFVTSVWFRQVAGFAFATVFSQRFALTEVDKVADSG